MRSAGAGILAQISASVTSTPRPLRSRCSRARNSAPTRNSAKALAVMSPASSPSVSRRRPSRKNALAGSGTLRHSSVSNTSSVSTERVPLSTSSTACWRRASAAAGRVVGAAPVDVIAELWARAADGVGGALCSGMEGAAG